LGQPLEPLVKVFPALALTAIGVAMLEDR